jgi:hypothetical protein
MEHEPKLSMEVPRNAARPPLQAQAQKNAAPKGGAFLKTKKR